jgi:hypothetical protein
MPEGLVPRMAIEWGFLILLAVGAAVADLSAGLIILVMAIGWILVVLVELVAWRARPRYAVTATIQETPAQIVEEAPPVSDPGVLPPVQTSAPPAYDFEFTRPGAKDEEASVEDTAVSAAPVMSPEEPDRPIDPDDPYAPAPERDILREADQRVSHRLEPLKPRPRRGWFRR